ncbi:Diacylglycerol kinase [Entamoeba marina]
MSDVLQIPIKEGIQESDFHNHNLCCFKHSFVACTSIGSKCAVCCYSIGSNSYCCTNCSIKVHAKCLGGVVVPCHQQRKGYVTKGLVNKYHSLRLTTFTSPKFCHICHLPFKGLTNQGYKCGTCGLTVHKHCSKSLNADCRPIKNVVGHPHHFIKGVKVGSKCTVCDCSIISSSTVTIRCTWCGLILHQCCLPKAPERCSYGVMADYIVPPAYIQDNNIIKKRRRIYSNSSGKKHLKRLLNPLQVYNIFEGWELVFNFVKEYDDNFILVVAGGDGTVGWALDECIRYKKNPQLVPLPLGTGNDLAHSFNWGSGYAAEKKLDRWRIVSDVSSPLNEIRSMDCVVVFQNYFSVGADADIVMDFHQQREANPKKFQSPLKNKMVYGMAYLNNARSKHELYKKVDIEVDNRRVDLKKLIGVCLLNIPMYAAGNKPWGDVTETEIIKGWKNSSVGDRIFEVIGFVDSLQLLECITLSGPASRIAQSNEIIIKVKADTLNCQCDGEPLVLNKGIYRICLNNQARMMFKGLI